MIYVCSKCKKELDGYEAYEYRGAYSCTECFEAVIEGRESERAEIIKEETSKTNVFKGLDLSDNTIGKANRDILKSQIEISKKETSKMKNYEGRV